MDLWLDDPFLEEFSECQTKVKTEEEINRFATSENMTELKRGVHLMRKGY